MTAMEMTIDASFLPHNDREASLACCRDTLGSEVRNLDTLQKEVRKHENNDM
jgi:hypothetical protein